MFARNRFPIAQASTCDDMLSGLAHAMGCGTIVEHDRQVYHAFLCSARMPPDTLPRFSRTSSAAVPK